MSFDSGKVESFGFPAVYPCALLVQEVLYHRGHRGTQGYTGKTGFLWTFVALVVEGLRVLRQVSFQQVVQAAGRAAQSDVETSEESADGADVVEEHLVAQLFQNQVIVGEKCDGQLPVVFI